MKKILPAALALLLLLSGCGRTRPPAPTQEPRTVQLAAATPSPTPAPTPTPTPTPEPTPEPADDAMVYVKDVDPTIRAELLYATSQNCSGAPIYDFTEPQLRYGTAKKLSAAQAILREQGYSILIWDAWRPPWAQFVLWERCPDVTYVANPYTGYSNHSRGCTVDISLTDLDGNPVEMPSGFDEFTALADRDYSDVSAVAAEHAQLLEDAMVAAGFSGYIGEWWHYDDTVRYPVAE